MLGPDWDGGIHVETKISSLNILWTIMIYVTTNDKDSRAVNYDQWNRKNVCVLVLEKLIPMWIAAENAKKNGTHVDGVSNYSPVSSGGLDLRPVTLNKGTDKELDIESTSFAE